MFKNLNYLHTHHIKNSIYLPVGLYAYGDEVAPKFVVLE